MPFLPHKIININQKKYPLTVCFHLKHNFIQESMKNINENALIDRREILTNYTGCSLKLTFLIGMTSTEVKRSPHQSTGYLQAKTHKHISLLNFEMINHQIIKSAMEVWW